MNAQPPAPAAPEGAKPGLLALLFGTRARVDRPTYLRVGVVLTLVKYAIDFGLIYGTTGHLWMPHEYLSPAVSTRSSILGGGNEWALALMIVLTLPFLWVGLSMTLRRAVDAGVSATVALLFLVPGVNYILMGFLAMMPSAPPKEQAVAGVDLHPRGKIIAALYGVLAGLGLGLGVTLFSTLVLRQYGEVLFLVTPGLIGAFAGWFFNQDEDRGLRATLGVSMLAVSIVGMAMLLFAIEGVICLVMAMPLALGLGLIGGALGRQMARFTRVAAGHLLVIFALTPLLGAVEAALPAPLVEREVATSVVIDAPPAAVWPNVVGFAELDAPPSLIYSVGVAYPLRARIEGEGVGAVRHCEFTTGAFVEPITAWEPHRRLAFDVIEQPAPMFEWSPYRHVHPPHLDGYLRSRRGEFRLIDLGDGRTRLEGSTWYTLDLAPSAYWALESDALIHGIHGRVLAHIKRLSEGGHVSVPAALDDRPLGG
ncbi:MAG: SRPBCC family protein [Myxococcales bacterium]|nr:SRPBCC family protein [Myxococcales bacterium]MCB9703694.1 SRPBCC family protein [Myxococcales bacterium]